MPDDTKQPRAFQAESGEPFKGWLRLNRGQEVQELIAYNHNAFVLLTVIALRARRTNSGLNLPGLAIGEALLGDFNDYSMTQQQYRTAKGLLQKCGLATFRATNKGTIGRIMNTRVYDINADPINEPRNRPNTVGQRTDNERLTTNNNLKNENKSLKGAGALALLPPPVLTFKVESSQDGTGNGEAEFMELVKYCLGTDYGHDGAKWRNRYRGIIREDDGVLQPPTKAARCRDAAVRVFAEISNMIKESRAFGKSAAAAAEDLWKRFWQG